MLHPLAPGQLARDLLGAAVSRLAGIPVLGRGLQRRPRVGLVLLAGRGPSVGAGDAADGALQNHLRG